MLMFVLVFGAVCAFFMAFGTGANDAANSVGPSVGAGALTVKKALVMGAIFELIGGVFVGQFVSATIRKGIVFVDAFADNPVDFAAGMLAALFGSSVWLFVATYYSLPVSTTHAIVGGIFGFALVARGITAINLASLGNIVLSWVISPGTGFLMAWVIFKLIMKTILNTDNPRRQAFWWAPTHFAVTICVMTVFLIESALKALKLDIELWLTIVIGVVAGIIAFAFTKFKIVPTYENREDRREEYKKERKKEDVKATDNIELDSIEQPAGPSQITLENLETHNELAGITKKIIDDDEDVTAWSDTATNVSSSDVGSALDLVDPVTELPMVIAHESAEAFDEHYDVDGDQMFTHDMTRASSHSSQMSHESDLSMVSHGSSEQGRISHDSLGAHAKNGRKDAAQPADEISVDIAPVVEPPKKTSEELRREAEKAHEKKQFDREVNFLGRRSAVPLFFFLQNLAAAFVALGHAANNIPNSTGPFAAIMAVFETNSIGSSYVLPIWIFVLASLSLDAGLLMYGKRVLMTIGEKVTLLTPTGGYAAQLSTSLTTIVCTRLGMPISTTHVLIGAVMGVGVARNGWKALKLKMILKIVVSWLATLPAAGVTAIVLYYIMDAIAGA